MNDYLLIDTFNYYIIKKQSTNQNFSKVLLNNFNLKVWIVERNFKKYLEESASIKLAFNILKKLINYFWILILKFKPTKLIKKKNLSDESFESLYFLRNI
jgi:hypothetical protein